MAQTTVQMTVILQPQTTMIVEVGPQPGVKKYATVAAMLAVRGQSGDIAYCFNKPDEWYKWSSQQQMWITANI